MNNFFTKIAYICGMLIIISFTITFCIAMTSDIVNIIGNINEKPKPIILRKWR